MMATPKNPGVVSLTFFNFTITSFNFRNPKNRNLTTMPVVALMNRVKTLTKDLRRQYTP